MSEFGVRPVNAADTGPLRAAVLRPGRPADESVYPGDDRTETLHAGAFEGGELVGVASVFREPPPGESGGRAWRLRGMAVSPSAQRKGYGRALLEACVAHAVALGGDLLWCNARSTAESFYLSRGFSRVGEEFVTADGLPHFLMRRRIP